MDETLRDTHRSMVGHPLPDETGVVSSRLEEDQHAVPLSKSSTIQDSNFSAEYSGDRPIIFFDGDCIMCNGFVDLLLTLDSKGLFYLSPLQGKTAAQYLPPLPQDREEWSIYYLVPRPSRNEGAALYSQSDAVIHICQRLGGIWTLVAVGDGIPAVVRNAVYRLVARNRYRLFGQRSTCRVPTDAEQARFLP